MAATTNHLAALRSSFLSRASAATTGLVLLEAAAAMFLAQRGLWLPAAIVVLVIELWAMRPGGEVAAQGRGAYVLERLPGLIIGLSVVLIILVAPRLATQIVTAVLFAVWRLWWSRERVDAPAGLLNLLFVQAAMFEAIFLAAAIWRPANSLILTVAWVGAYLSVYAVLSRRQERAAGVLAAAWAVIVVEISWVLLLWLFTYTMSGGYVLVPQPALILTALAYCFGSIYVSQREGTLSRARLTEYVLIGLILVAIVVTGTSWHGSL